MIFDVIIIGAGISGLAAAKELFDNNVKNFFILEAKEKIGGRISTIEFGSSIIEIGAQFIHGEHNSLYEIVKKLNHIHPEKSWEAKGTFYMPHGHSIKPDDVTWVNDTLEVINFKEENPTGTQPKITSIGAYLEAKFREKYRVSCSEDSKSDTDTGNKNALFQWAKLFQEIDNSCASLHDLSLRRWSEFVVNPGHWQNNFRYGAKAFLEGYFSDILNPKWIKFSCPVEKVFWTNANVKDDQEFVEIITQNGAVYKCRSLICTIPIGVLKHKMHSMFIPNLPEVTVNAIMSTGFGSITKIFLEWESPWWMQEQDHNNCKEDKIFYGIQIVWPVEHDNDKEADNFPQWTKGITGFDPVLNNPNVLLAWVGGQHASTVELLDEAEVGIICQKVLGFFLGHEVPVPKNCLVSKWGTDPCTRGSYSYRSVQGDTIPGDISAILSEPVFTLDKSEQKKPTILFAGEACHKTQYSSIQGALESGTSQSNVVIRYLKNLYK